MLKLKWFGHSMWQISSDELTVITDPFTEIGYPMPKGLTADIVLSSHDHFDHNNFSLVGNDPKIVNSEGEFELPGIRIQNFAVYHDENEGDERGKNMLMKFKIGGRNFLHCGDLGHMITDELIAKIGKIDVLLIPIGGHFTIDAITAKEIVDKIDPILTFPMHYKTDVLDFPIKPKESYIKLITDHQHIKKNEIELTGELFSQRRTMTLQYEA